MDGRHHCRDIRFDSPRIEERDGALSQVRDLARQGIPQRCSLDGHRLTHPPDVADRSSALHRRYVDGFASIPDRQVRGLLGRLGQMLQGRLGRCREPGVGPDWKAARATRTKLGPTEYLPKSSRTR